MLQEDNLRTGLTVSIPIAKADGLRNPMSQNKDDVEFKKTWKKVFSKETIRSVPPNL